MALPKIATPIYETNLISTGKSIKFRPFLVKEQKLFLMAAQSDDAKEVVSTIKQVLNNCILSDEVKVNSLPVFDLEHLFLQIRARSVGEVVNLKYTCNNDVDDGKEGIKKCGGLVKLDLNLLEVQPTKDPSHSNKIELTDKLGIVMKYPNFDMIQKLNVQNESDLLDVVIACIDFVYDEDQVYYAKDTPKKELEEFIENLQQSDMEKLQKFFQTMPKISKRFDFSCPKCGYSENVNIEGIQNFFG